MVGKSYNPDKYKSGDYETEEPSDHIKKTAFTLPLMSEDWVREIDEPIVIGTYRHKIVLLPYLISILLTLGLGGLIFYYVGSVAVGVGSVVLSLLILTIGLFKYWSTYYVMTEEVVIRVSGLFTGSIPKKTKHKNVQESETEIPVTGRIMDLLLDYGYGNIILRTASDSADNDGVKEQNLMRIASPRDFIEIENMITSDDKTGWSKDDDDLQFDNDELPTEEFDNRKELDEGTGKEIEPKED